MSVVYQIKIIETKDNTRVNIEEKSSMGNIILRYNGSDDKFQPIMSSELNFDLLVSDAMDGKYLHLFTGSETHFKVQLEDITTPETPIVIWEGFILPDLYSEPYTNDSFFVSFTASDGLGRLKNKYLPANFYTDTKSVSSIIAECLKATGLSLPLAIAPAIENAIVSLTVDQLEIDTTIFIDKEKKQNAYQILEDLITSLGCKLFQYNQTWYIIGINRMGIDNTIILDITAPSIPALLTMISKTSTTANFSWQASTDNVAVTGYKIYKNDVYVTTVTALNYTATGLTASTAYGFKVSAIDAANNESDKSTVLTITTTATTDTTPPAVPVGLAVASVTSAAISLTWTANTEPDLAGYKIFRNGVHYATVYTNSGVVTGLTSNTAYNFQIKAYDSSGNESALCSVVIGTTAVAATDTIAPTVPLGLSLSPTASSTTVIINWNAATDNVAVTGYRLERTINGGAYTEIYNGLNLTFSDVGGVNTNTHTYRVRAYDAAGNHSNYSSEISIYISDQLAMQ